MARELTEFDRQRGRRLKEIRDALGLTQAEIVARLNAAAESLGLPDRYEYYSVSRMEKGSVGFEDAAAWLQIDPGRKEGPFRWDWFVLGEREKGIDSKEKSPRAKPAPGLPRPAVSSREADKRKAK